MPSVLLDDDPSRNILVPRLHPHTQSMLGRSPNEGIYSNLYDKDMSLMRKLMNLDDFQCSNNISGSGITAPTSDIPNASKQFHSYTNGNNGGIFNSKFTNATNFASAASFPYDKQQQQPQNGMRSHLHHEGLLKPCYDDHYTTPNKVEATATTLDDNFGSNPMTVSGGYNNSNNNSKKLFSSNGNNSNGGGFMNQFPHDSLFGANNHHHHHHQAFASKLNEINNNNNNNNGGGIVIKLENGGQHANDFTKLSVESTCSRSSTTMATASNIKTEPNEFRNNGNNSGSNNIKDNDDERKHHEHSNDGFTQL